ncbi:hypothetical protein [Pseudomonas aeruginosa]|uniref:hypothetical protein n=1 Tax=Pseudomonas aeruginosa TaxID=287 RepID=UPI00071B01B5|nr:hypothetical protein [Pseudomonas aeruginosa]KSC69708.1 hypothetical protein AO895_09815 [Pseudomonas aeruginosa]KSC86742.1 hypothetical protein AO894_11145 [Pseudomonas aeruginosa]MDI3907001.1 hypothetical protein [Pseudomonas aeruginosa]MDI4010295.1 hypothetical protein [Pseudomonas aeruginosa]HBO3623014.1 hypothetical protein [Pseudomonas aeruginosa]
MFHYMSGTKRYSFSYQEALEEYWRVLRLPDDEFAAQLPAILHLSCFICWFKEVPTRTCLTDTGVIHEIAHALHSPDRVTPEVISNIRRLFKTTCKLVR